MGAIMLRCSEGAEGRKWMRGPSTLASHAEALLPCLSAPGHATIRTAAAQSMARALFDADGDDNGDGIIFVLSCGGIPPLVQACVDAEISVAAAAFRAVSFIVCTASKGGREAAGLVLAAKTASDAMIEIVKAAEAGGEPGARIRAWTAALRMVSVDPVCGGALHPLPFNHIKYGLQLEVTEGSDELALCKGVYSRPRSPKFHVFLLAISGKKKEKKRQQPERKKELRTPITMYMPCWLTLWWVRRVVSSGAIEILAEAADNQAATSAMLHTGSLQALVGILERGPEGGHLCWADAMVAAGCFVANYGEVWPSLAPGPSLSPSAACRAVGERGAV